MSRISIDVTPQQHRQLKAIAALAGKSLKEYLLAHTLPHREKEASLQELESFLEPRLHSAHAGDVSKRSVSDIWQTVKQSSM